MCTYKQTGPQKPLPVAVISFTVLISRAPPTPVRNPARDFTTPSRELPAAYLPQHPHRIQMSYRPTDSDSRTIRATVLLNHLRVLGP